jgi:hypothetical protein
LVSSRQAIPDRFLETKSVTKNPGSFFCSAIFVLLLSFLDYLIIPNGCCSFKHHFFTEHYPEKKKKKGPTEVFFSAFLFYQRNTCQRPLIDIPLQLLTWAACPTLDQSVDKEIKIAIIHLDLTRSTAEHIPAHQNWPPSKFLKKLKLELPMIQLYHSLEHTWRNQSQHIVEKPAYPCLLQHYSQYQAMESA